MKKIDFLNRVIEEDPETRYYTKKELRYDDCLKRDDDIDSFYMKARIYIFWIIGVMPFRLFHIFFFLIFYCVWYQFFVRFLTKIPVINRGCHCLDFWVKIHFLPYYAWWVSLQYGFYNPKVIHVEKSVFKKICEKYQGEAGTPRKKSPYIVVANHSSYCDTLCMFRHFGERGVVAKVGLKYDMILGPLMRELGCIFTDSKNIGTQIIKKTKKYYDDPLRFKKIMIFPEGTTTNGRHILKFHRGAFIPGAPLDICVIRYDYKYFDPSWANCSSAIQYFESLHSQFYQDYYLLRFPVYNPNEEEKKDSKLFASNVRKVMCDVCNYYTAEKFGEMKLRNILFVRHMKNQ